MPSFPWNTAAVSVAANATTVVIAAPASGAIAVYEWLITADGPVYLTFLDGANVKSGPHRIASDGQGIAQDVRSSGSPRFVLAPGNSLSIQLSGTGKVGGHINWALT